LCHIRKVATDFKIDDNGDLVKRNGDLVLVSGKEEIAQRLKSRFKTFYREWVYDTRRGFPTVGKGGMFDSSTPLIFRLAMLRKYILDTAGIISVTTFDPTVDQVAKVLSVAVTAQTEYGEITEVIEI
jgi:hypothetical protein